LWEEGAKGPEGESSWQELKSKEGTFDMLCPMILEKEVKGFSVRKGNLFKIITLKVLVGGWEVSSGADLL
jgi:hypothetical protein